MARLDPHSYNDDTQPETASFSWRARVDFTAQVIEAEVELELRQPSDGRLDLDTRDLEVREATDDAGRSVPFVVHPAEPILGSRLELMLHQGTRRVRIAYRTSPGASALQWLAPAQTAGGKEPYLFSQCQAIHARSVVPLQDTPRLRVRYQAELTVPVALKAVMAAAFVDRRVEGPLAVERYQMPQPIPPYLFAFAVGDLAAQDVSPRSRVWAEPSVLPAAAAEFSGVEAMIAAAEKLFGPYDWERFDILAMPPSFPYGGMENPRLTFLTPTLIAGDKSLVSVVAHELAHSWTGNLVTNANAEHFWLNEGFTVYAERRIQEALEGLEMTSLHAALGRRALNEAVARFAQTPDLTKLRTRLVGVDPDEAFSVVPYEKGYLFLRTLEEAVGRERFDAFLKKYLTRFRFQSTTTEQLVAMLEEELPGALAKVDAPAWLDGRGVPGNAAVMRSRRLEAVEALGEQAPGKEQAKSLTPTEWQLYLERLPHPAPSGLLEELDGTFRLTASRNYEVLVAWLSLAASSGYRPAFGRLEEVLRQVGRMKYLRPLYTALAGRDETRALAKEWFGRFRAGYHPIAQQVIEGVLKR